MQYCTNIPLGNHTRISRQGLSKREKDLEIIHPYVPVVTDATAKHFAPIEFCQYMPGINTVVMIERDANFLSIFGADLMPLRTISRSSGYFTAATHIKGHYVTSSTDRDVTFYDDTHGIMQRSFRVPYNTLALSAFSPSGIGATPVVYTAGSTGVVNVWDAMTLEERFHTASPHKDSVLDILAVPTLCVHGFDFVARFCLDRRIFSTYAHMLLEAPIIFA